MRLYIIRHGETDWNAKKLLQGGSETVLNEKGRRLAVLTGEALKDISFDKVYSSPLHRAMETAQLVVGDRDVEIIPESNPDIDKNLFLRELSKVADGINLRIIKISDAMTSNRNKKDDLYKDNIISAKFSSTTQIAIILAKNNKEALDKAKELYLAVEGLPGYSDYIDNQNDTILSTMILSNPYSTISYQLIKIK